MSLPSDRRRWHRPLLAVVVGSAALAAVPTPASAKVFVASFKDKSGDGAAGDSRDVVQGRVAYNRKTGALSASVRMAADVIEGEQDAVVALIVSDLTNGKCTRVTMTMGTVLSDPSVPVAWLGARAPKKKWYGAGSVEGDTLKMRVKAKGLAGRTPGCTAVYVTTLEEQPTLIDDTPINNGFA